MADTFAQAMDRLASALRERREERALTQEDVAHEAGIATRHLQDLEHGRSANPTIKTLWTIADVLETTVADLLAARPKKLDRKSSSKKRKTSP